MNKQDHIFIKKIRKKIFKTMLSYSMIESDDRVLIAFSGGKDSIVLTDVLLNLKKTVKFDFTVSALMIGNSHLKLKEMNGIKLDIIGFTPKNIKKEKNGNYCHICSRIRRGSIYEYAQKNSFNKIALGHHLDDVIETFFMNQLYHAKLETMKPVLISDDKKNTIIRPMHAILEKDIIRYFDIMEFKRLNTVCPFGISKSKRGYVKDIFLNLSDIEKYNIYNSIREFF